MDSVLPPLDDPLPNLLEYVDFNARHNGSKSWLLFPSVDATSSGLRSVSFADLNYSSHKAAHIFRPNRSGPEGGIVAVLLHTDTVLYAAVMLGLMRAGLVPYPMSPRNSPQGISHMLRTTSCTRVVAHSLTTHTVEQVSQELASEGITLQVNDLPSLHELFPRIADPSIESIEIPTYPSPAKQVVLEDLAMMIHSSGSTGYPKSIPLYHRRILQWMRHNVFGSPKAAVKFAGMGLPTFHAMGFLLQVCYPMSSGKPVVVHAPQYPSPPVLPHPQNILEAAILAQCTAIVALPSFIEAWSHSQEAIDYLRTLEVLVYSGGPLSTVVGDKMVAAGVPIFGAYGGTETGNPTQLWNEVPRSQLIGNPDWEWLRIADTATVEWEPQGDGSYELIVFENKDYRLGAYNVPGKKAFATSDLFVPHPTKEGLWRIVGRTDDVIILSTGEKIVPLPQEGTVGASPLVAGCIMFGREREQAGILIEPVTEHAVNPKDDAAVAVFRNKIWPVVEQANATAPAFARIFKEMILVADPDRPMPRSAKGAVVRKMSLNLYAGDIDMLYEAIAESSNAKGIDPPINWSLEHISPWLLAHAKSLINQEDVSYAGDLFAQGFDSLSATFFRNRIIGALRSSTKDAQVAANCISSNFIFEHSSIRRLAIAISGLVQSGSEVPLPKSGVSVAEIQTMVERFTAGLTPSNAKSPKETFDSPVVLLTGATGNIGSHILAQLLADESISRVYTLDRASADPVQRLQTAFELRRLPVDLLHKSKFVSLAGDVTRPNFGLSEERYREVTASVTHLIHNAWSVNFNLPLHSFEGQIAGVRKLVDICAAASHSIRLMVTSSIGVANGWSQGPVPEDILPDPKVASSSGYAASKYVVEKILNAASKCGLSVLALRMGQACGPRATGAWGTNEWLPMLIKSSATLGSLPDMTGPVSWMPLDAIGHIYSDWVACIGELPRVVNVVHPLPTTWDVIYRDICDELGSEIPRVPLVEWVSKLENVVEHATESDLTSMPALKILEFFRELAGLSTASKSSAISLAFDTAQLWSSSRTARELQPISEEHARMWVRYWRNIGYIAS